MRKTRRLFLMAFAISLFMSFAATSAFAAQGGGSGSGKPCPSSSPVGQLLGSLNPGAPNCGNGNGGGGNNGGGNGGGQGNTCPPNSPNPGGTPPNCGHPPADTCHDGKDNDHDGKTDAKDEECQNPGDGDEDGSDNAPEGKCASADLVLLTPDARIVCLYLQHGELATTDEECEGALIATGAIGPLGACVFLPPEGSSVPKLPTP